MNLRDLEYLVAIADHRHFGRAAEASFVSQPTLSTQLKKLERELGVTLVERSRSGAILTPAGAAVVEHARIVLRETADIRRIARHASDPLAASLRIGLFPTLGPYLLPHVVPKVRERYPRLEMLLVEEKTEHVLAHLVDGSLDVGVLALPVHDDGLLVEPLFTEDFLLAVPAAHPLANHDGPVDIAALAGEQLLLLEEGHCLRDQALSVCQINGASERRGFRATSLETLRQMVAAGVGITLLPELSVRPPVARSPGIHLLRFREPVPSRHIAMVRRSSSVHGELVSGLASVFRDLPNGYVRVDAAPQHPLPHSS
ncbi:MAG: LysR family transcriptional regulator [Actinobacteria bacterium]|nr:LysR family transcriptional regulator [Actinomycetota bacterium]